MPKNDLYENTETSFGLKYCYKNWNFHSLKSIQVVIQFWSATTATQN